MTNRSVVAILASVLLVACASPESVRQKGAIYRGTSSKPPEKLAGCIGDELQTIGITRLTARPTKNGYTVMREDEVAAGSDTVLVVDIDADANGSSSIKFFSNLVFGFGDRKVVDAIKRCE
jgi:hypothetical protein